VRRRWAPAIELGGAGSVRDLIYDDQCRTVTLDGVRGEAEQLTPGGAGRPQLMTEALQAGLERLDSTCAQAIPDKG
jgi:hypothetical protein